MKNINTDTPTIEEESTPVKVLIGTPAYGSVVYTDYLHSILSFVSIKGLNTTIITLGNESLITRARNKLFTMFVNGNFDYLLFLDADMFFNVKSFAKLLASGKHLIGAPVRLKSDTNVVLNCEVSSDLEAKNYPIFEVDKIGSAVMLISRELALAVVEECKRTNSFYENNVAFSRGDNFEFKDNIIYDVFKVGQIDGQYLNNKEYLSEDYYFCKLVQKLGYKTYINADTVTVHNGTLQLPYVGNPNYFIKPNDENKLASQDKVVDKEGNINWIN